MACAKKKLCTETFVSELLANPAFSSRVDYIQTCWVTQIPLQCVKRIREVQGFTGAQKEEDFKYKEASNKIISHIEASRSLGIMEQIPVFCWITASVREHTLTTEQKKV